MRSSASPSNRSPLKGAVLLCALLAAPGIQALSSSPPGPPAVHGTLESWKIVAVSGSVEALIIGTERATRRDIARGDELQARTHVRTGWRGRTTLSHNANMLIVAPGSAVELSGGRDEYGDTETSVIQATGSVLYRVDSRSIPHLEVITDYLVAVAEGSTFLVTVNRRYTAVTVEHGLVQITDLTSGWVTDLGPGETVIRHGDNHADLVHNQRYLRAVRREFKQLARMNPTRQDAGKPVAYNKPKNAHTVFRRDPSDKDSAPPDRTEVKARDDVNATDDINATDELIEEMIREGIKDGWLVEPERRDGVK